MLQGTRRARVVGCALLIALLGACSGGSDPGPTTPAPSATTLGPASSDTAVSKVIVLIIENHSPEQVAQEMPATSQLLTTYASADNYHAVAHPSLPNYLAIVGGTTSGVHDSRGPSAHARHGASVFGQALAQGRTAKVYAEGLPEPCALEDDGDTEYAVRHNTWTYHLDERAQCAAHDTSLDDLAGDVAAGDLPTVAMAVPDLCNSGHDCELDTTDEWVSKQVALLQSGPDWASGHLAIIITADEDDAETLQEDPVNLVIFGVIHPALRGVVIHDQLSHLSLSRGLSEMSGSAPLADAADAPSIWPAVGLGPT